MSSTYLPSYSSISLTETRKLAKNKAGGSVWAVYAVLVSYSRDGAFEVFPSWDTINRVLDGAYSRKSIANALNWLESHKIIKRKKSKARRSKTIKLITRCMNAGLEKLVKPKKKNNSSYYSQRKRKNPTPTKKSGNYKHKYRSQDPEISKKLDSECNNLHQKKIIEDKHSISMNSVSVWWESAVAHLIRPDLWLAPNPYHSPEQILKLIDTGAKWFPPGEDDSLMKLAYGVQK
jgi:hypothetical protein